MAVTINASTTAGLVQTADTSGVLALQTAGTTAISIGSNQNVNFAGTAQRITGDFSNATVANRVAFQNSVTNGSTQISLFPNGTSDTSLVRVFNNSDPTNCGTGLLYIDGVRVGLDAGITGTGTYLPTTFQTGGSESLRLSATSKAVILAGGSTSANGTGITFPATQSASTDANTLDDYEEGTWTPNQGAGLTVVGTFGSSGSYTKVGRLVTVIGLVTGSTSIASSAGGAISSNLPFTSASGTVGGVADSNGGGGSCLTSTTSVLSYPAHTASPGIYFTATYAV